MQEIVPVLLGFVVGVIAATKHGRAQVEVLVLLSLVGGPLSSLATGELTHSGGMVFVAIDTLQLVASAAITMLLARWIVRRLGSGLLAPR
jgi:hypothetical protein